MANIDTATIAQALPIFHLEAQGIQAVDARTLHTWLGIGRDFSTWFKQMINELDFEEGKEFSPNLGSGADLRKRGFAPGGNRKDYALTLDAAKEICLIQRSEKGKLTRPRDDDRAIVRRAAKQAGGPVRRAWWEYDATPCTAELSDALLALEPDLPPTLQTSTFAGLATIDDEHAAFTSLYSGDRNA